MVEAGGIVSGGKDLVFSGCYDYFTGLEEAVQAWGGDLNFNY